jgi:hypothetical protein
MRNGSRVADEVYIQRVLLVLQGFLFFSLYSFSCIAKQVMTLKKFLLFSCLEFLETDLEPLVLISDITFKLPISPTSDPAHYTDNELDEKGEKVGVYISEASVWISMGLIASRKCYNLIGQGEFSLR